LELPGLLVAEGVGPDVLELIEREGDGAAAVERVPQHLQGRPQRGEGERQDAAELRRIDGDRGRRQPAPGEDLGEQPAEGVPDERGLLAQLPDQLGDVVDDLAHRLVGEGIGVRPSLLDGLGVIRPRRSQRRVPGLLEQPRPAVPAARQEPEPVDEDDRGMSGGLCLVDLPGSRARDRRHANASVLSSMSQLQEQQIRAGIRSR
jgi:hypothetical protein